MIESLQEALIDGKHNQLIVAIMGGVFVFFGAGRRFISNAFTMARHWLASRAAYSRSIENCEQALQVWNSGIEAKVLEALDEHELHNVMLFKRLEHQIEHTNALLESFITENQAEMNNINRDLSKIRKAGL